MASIDRTTYPRFRPHLHARELEALYEPTEQEIAFVRNHAKTKDGRLTLLVLLKCHQHLGYMPALSKVPQAVINYLRIRLGVSDGSLRFGPRKVRQRYRVLIHGFLDISPYRQGGQQVAVEVIRASAHTMSDPADLINAAIEQLIQKRFELPAYSTLDRLTRRLRQEVHKQIYANATAGLNRNDISRLDKLLRLKRSDRRTDFIRLKEPPGPATLSEMRCWVQHLRWLDNLLSADTAALLREVTHTKQRQFAAEAHALELGDMRDIRDVSKRHTLLICLVHRARSQARDDLVTMFLKRMRRIYTASADKLSQLQDEHREIEERMVTAFAEVVGLAVDTKANAVLGRKVRDVITSLGGAEEIQDQYLQVSAYYGNNHLPLIWSAYRTHRAALLRLVRLLHVESATQNELLLKALHFVLDNENTRRDYVDGSIDLSFVSGRWKELVEHQHEGETVLNRRQLEVCVLSYLAHALRCGDMFVPGSEAFADYREQLLPWPECEKRLQPYCEATGLPTDAFDFVKKLEKELTDKTKSVDKSYRKNKDLSIDADGRAHLKRIKTVRPSQALKGLLKRVRRRMPERHLLDILRDVNHWTGYTRHFGPPSGSDPKLSDQLRRYLFTVFGFGCGLGASQTARHSLGKITLRVLDRINQQHITMEDLEGALRDIIAKYTTLELPHHWGSGSAAIADGTHVELRENNLLGEQHIRYGAYGGIAYHHISDTYIALFSHFVACGVWEAVYILDGMLKNTSEIQPDTVHADTQGQSEPVFGLAFLLGVKLMPRMRTWNDVVFYRSHHRVAYRHIDPLFTGTVNWQLIRKHWQDMMQVVLSIQAGKAMPSMLLKRLGTYSRTNTLYRAFRELGRVVRTLYLLDYISDKELRHRVDTATTKVESFNAFCDWISFGGELVTSDDPVEQEKRVKYTTLVANAVMLQNATDLSDVLVKLAQDGYPITRKLLSLLSPYLTGHIKRFGQFAVDTEAEPLPLNVGKIPIEDELRI